MLRIECVLIYSCWVWRRRRIWVRFWLWYIPVWSQLRFPSIGKAGRAALLELERLPWMDMMNIQKSSSTKGTWCIESKSCAHKVWRLVWLARGSRSGRWGWRTSGQLEARPQSDLLKPGMLGSSSCDTQFRVLKMDPKVTPLSLTPHLPPRLALWLQFAPWPLSANVCIYDFVKASIKPAGWKLILHNSLVFGGQIRAQVPRSLTRTRCMGCLLPK